MTNFLLLFDLDGTLIDSVPDLTSSLNEVLREHGYSPLSRDEVAPMVGDGVPILVARAFAARGGSAEEAAATLPHYVKVYESKATELTRPYPGVRDTLVELRRRGYRCAICTNKLQQATLRVLGGLGLADLFDGIAGGDHYPVRKPDGGHLTRLVDELGGEVARSVMIGDSENDAAAAHDARVPVIMMRYGYARIDPATLGGVALLDRFDELPAALERLGFTP
ncbi:MAG TPA: HAD-IA family hydrolase [Stellaceae bacterium]|jgi:phosphoglycolate phosphatase|nr:HAD-IA family hydrolase [Stellaceae bacterium]